MANEVCSEVVMYDIRSDKSEASLLDMIKQCLSSEPKSMPTLLLYDEAGLKIFEEITYLEEYYLTNAEIDALTRHADSIAEHIPAGARLIELGSGNLRKVNILLEALERAKKEVDYFALDLSLPELERTFAELNTSNFKYVRFNALHGTYDDGLAWLSKPENSGKVTCILSLGSSIGNFDRPGAAKFLHQWSQVLGPADMMMIGVDATTDGDRVFRAYNDSLGVTERFNRNGLDHANKLLGYEAFKQQEWGVKGEYNAEGHQHRAFYVALADVTIEGIKIKKGEELFFEQSDKYTDEEANEIWYGAGLVPKALYTDVTGNHHIHMLKPSSINFETTPEIYAPLPVPTPREWHQLWSAWDTVTRSMVPRDELMNKPIQLRNNLIFYLGHIPTFADIHYTRATGEKPTDPKYYYQIFERGIDPDVDDPTKCHSHSEIPDTWPPLEEILQYQVNVRNRIIESIESGKAASDRKLGRGLTLAYEHEAMHLETFLYMLLQSEKVLPPPGQPIPDFRAEAEHNKMNRTKNAWHTIPSTKITVGDDDLENNDPPERYFLWDNERPSRKVSVPTFQVQSRPISIGEYAKFLEATHSTKLPASWTTSKKVSNGVNGVNGISTINGEHAVNGFRQNGVNGTGTEASSDFLEGIAIRTVYGPIPLKFALDWPLMASYDELAAFAEWSGGRIPTADELRSIYHYVETQKAPAQNTCTLVPAVNGHLSNDGVEETPPSRGLSNGDGPQASPTLDPKSSFIDLHGCNVGFKNWYTTPVTSEGSRLRGRGDAGGLWEWSSTPLAYYEGFKAMDLYPGYTADFFDEKHNVCLGGSWATVPRIVGRKSFVNWYQRNYPYVWCTARLARDVA